MAPGFSEHLLHELACAVCDLGLPIKAVIRLDEHPEAHNAGHLREVAAELICNHRKRVQRALLRGLLRIFNRHLRRHRTGGQKCAVCHRKLTRNKDEVARASGRDVRRDWLWCCGKGHAQSGEGVVRILGV